MSAEVTSDVFTQTVIIDGDVTFHCIFVFIPTVTHSEHCSTQQTILHIIMQFLVVRNEKQNTGEGINCVSAGLSFL